MKSSAPLRILIYEYITGGGFIESPLFPPLICEAYAMLSALLKDFSHNAGYEVEVILDRRLAEAVELVDARRITKVSSISELRTVFASALSEVDAALIVAPETDGLLESLTETAEDSECGLLLGSTSKALQHVSNKMKAIEVARSAGVAVPETAGISADEEQGVAYRIARDIGLPVVIKPQEGAGCQGVFVVNNREDLERALNTLGIGNVRRKLLLQQYIRGIDASVSVVSSKSRHVLPLSMNRQLIELKTPQESSSYEGGYSPLDHHFKREAFEYARRIVESVEGLKGHVGIDFVLTEEKPVFMEANARITTSYAGLYRILRTDGRKGVANAIIDAAVNDKLPSYVELNSYVCYSKFSMKPDIRTNKDMIDVLSNLEYVESPPLPENEKGMEAFLTGEGNSLDEALAAKSRNEKKFDMIARKFVEPLPNEH